MIRFQTIAPLLSLFLAACAPAFYEEQNLSAKPFNQLELAGNACGPAALLNSSRFGSQAWRKISENPPALTDRDRIRAIARGPAMRESASLPGRARWSKSGINLSDLRDVANELAAPHFLPAVLQHILFLKSGESQILHLARVRSLLARSLDHGFSPILSLRRYANRGGQWTLVQAHFVTITSVPGNIAYSQTEFPVKFIDPWGGRFREGSIGVMGRPFLGKSATESPNLTANFPDVTVGKSSVRPGEESILVVSAALAVP